MKVVVLDSLFESLEVESDAAAQYGATVERWDGDLASLADADVVAHVRTRVDAGLIAAMTGCRIVTRFGTGRDTVDLAAAEAAGIAVVTVRDYCIRELCSHTLALAFALTRRLAETSNDLDASWQSVAGSTPLSRFETAAIVGLGSIGSRIAAALRALDFDVVAVTRTPARAEALGIPTAALDDAIGFADLVFLHTALDDSTTRLLDERRLRLFKPTAILVDTARLGVLDEAAVATALEERRLGGVALDGQLAPTSPLRRLVGDPRVLVTPHLGWYSDASASALRRAAITNALERLGRPDTSEAATA